VRYSVGFKYIYNLDGGRARTMFSPESMLAIIQEIPFVPPSFDSVDDDTYPELARRFQ
jgi:hypothetical protein